MMVRTMRGLGWVALLIGTGSACHDTSVGKFNDEPTAAISEPEANASFSEGDAIAMLGVVGDPNTGVDTLKAQWWVGSELGCDWSAVESDGSTSCEAVVGTESSVRLLVIDPSGATGEDAVEIVVQPNQTPSVEINAPVDGATFTVGESFELEAAIGDDHFDAGLTLNLEVSGESWDEADASDMDSEGTFSAVLHIDEVGSHPIKLSATDSLGRVGSDTITVHVGAANEAPYPCSFVSPASRAQYAVGDLIPFAVEVADSDDDLDTLQGVLESSLDGVVAGPTAATSDGEWEAAVDTLSPGVHNMLFTVTDPHGGDCVANLAVEVCNTVWWRDADDDDFGVSSDQRVGCLQPEGYVEAGGDEDCDDSDPTIHPLATEVCDGVDQDCDGIEDNGVTTTFYADSDSDGYGDPASTQDACAAPSGFVSDASDCDDTSSAVHPGATEVCNSIDDDCDLAVDDDDSSLDTSTASTFYADSDGDGYGDASTTTLACSVPSGFVADDADCDDGDSSVNPGAPEVCSGRDDDCDGFVDDDDSSVDTSTGDPWYADSDNDRFGNPSSSTMACSQPSGFVSDDTDCLDTDANTFPGAAAYESATDCMTDADGDDYGDSTPFAAVTAGTDCDDADASISPAETEVCDEVDQDCDGVVDNGVQTTFYADSDADGYGDLGSTQDACSVPSGYVSDTTDCDDTDASIHPAATELPGDEVDQDCDGTEVCYADSDGDGYTDGSTVSSSDTDCTDTGEATASALTGDCDDTVAAVNPGASEVCNTIDDDCDGDIDDADSSVDTSAGSTFYADSDGDGYGDAASSTEACAQPSGFVGGATDCDDSDSAVNPAATEVCNTIDDDCDGDTDDADSSLDSATADTWYSDSDADGYGSSAVTTLACAQPSGYVADDSDCDDSDADRNPGEVEVCDASDKDEDCDGLADDADSSVSAATQTTFYADSDSDGYGDALTTTDACDQPSGFVTDSTDCDDADSAVNPGATEVCSGVDDDCDGDIDDDDASVDTSTGGSTFYADSDGDGYGDSSVSTQTCAQPSGYVSDATDCDDGDSGVHPSASEVCNAIDDDCDGDIDDDDSSVDTSSGGSTYYADADGDGYGDSAVSTLTCAQPSSYVSDSTDCDDAAAAVNPGADEVCGDSLDNNCNGIVDGGMCGTVASTEAEVSLYGAAGQDYLGGYVDFTGDVDGDGLDDLFFGATGVDDAHNDSGRGYMVFGGASGTLSVSDVDATILAYEYGSYGGQLGISADGGDYDGDGYADLLVGANNADPRNHTNQKPGAAYFIFGPFSGSLRMEAGADMTVYGEGSSAGSYAGRSVAGVGDMNSDGYDDWVVGAYGPGSSGGSFDGGTAYLILGASSVGSAKWELSSADAEVVGGTSGSGRDGIGYCTGSAGDLDGDGYYDALVGSHGYGNYTGVVYVMMGNTSVENTFGTPDYAITGDTTGHNLGTFGIDQAGVGDLNGDGYGDLALGNPYDDTSGTDAGAVFVVYGPLSSCSGCSTISDFADATLTGVSAGDNLGLSLAATGDLDSDGLVDFAVGAPNVSSSTGAAYVVYGATSLTGTLPIGSEADATLSGPSSSSNFGYSMAGGGDFDGDGINDLVVGAYTESTSATSSGAGYLFLGGFE